MVFCSISWRTDAFYPVFISADSSPQTRCFHMWNSCWGLFCSIQIFTFSELFQLGGFCVFSSWKPSWVRGIEFSRLSLCAAPLLGSDGPSCGIKVDSNDSVVLLFSSLFKIRGFSILVSRVKLGLGFLGNRSPRSISIFNHHPCIYVGMVTNLVWGTFIQPLLKIIVTG